MIEAAVITALKADATLAGYIGTYRSEPAVFSDFAPEAYSDPNAALGAYITVRNSCAPEDDRTKDIIKLEIDFWDYGSSRTVARNAIRRIRYLLRYDTALTTAEYRNIRCWCYDAGEVDDESDPRAIHYNALFECHAIRVTPN